MVLATEPQLPPPPGLTWGLVRVIALEMGDDLLFFVCFIPELVSWNGKLFTTLLSALAPPPLVAPLRELRVACGLVFLAILCKVL